MDGKLFILFILFPTSDNFRSSLYYINNLLFSSEKIKPRTLPSNRISVVVFVSNIDNAFANSDEVDVVVVVDDIAPQK